MIAEPVPLGLWCPGCPGGWKAAVCGSRLPCIVSSDLAAMAVAAAFPLPVIFVITVLLLGVGEPYLRLSGRVRSSGSSPPQTELPASDGAPPLGSSSRMSPRRGPVGDARALSSAGLTLTPAFAKSLEANSGSKGLGIGSTGRSFVLIPRCCRDMCECRELRDFATVPQRTQRYPGQIVCLSSRCVRNVCAER